MSSKSVFSGTSARFAFLAWNVSFWGVFFVVVSVVVVSVEEDSVTGDSVEGDSVEGVSVVVLYTLLEKKCSVLGGCGKWSSESVEMSCEARLVLIIRIRFWLFSRNF